MAIKVSGTTVINDSRALENITDIPNIIKSSSIQSPANGSTDTGAGKFITIDVSPFQAVFGVSSSLQVQVDNNSDFSSPIYNVTTTTTASEVEIDGDAYNFPTSTLVYVRARYADGDGNLSDWTPTISFTTRSAWDAVSTPSITSPANGATDVEYESPTFTSSAFATSGGSYTHTWSDWQLASDSSFSTLVTQVSSDTTNKTSWTPSVTLDFETVYYVRVRHYNSTIGYSDWSSGSSFTTSIFKGSVEYTTGGSYQWTAPANVTSVSAVVIGAGGGGGGGHDASGGNGGALAWKNNISVTPGTAYTVVVGNGGTGGSTTTTHGTAGTASYFISTGTVYAAGGEQGYYDDTGTPASYTTGRTGDGGGNGGGNGSSTRGGGGGAGGYSGAGGRSQGSNQTTIAPDSNSGAGSAGVHLDNVWGWGGGGVGLYGKGSTGAQTVFSGTYTYGTLSGNTTSLASALGEVMGKGGSGGEDGHPSSPSDQGVQSNYQMSQPGPRGGLYGGGGGGATSPGGNVGGNGANGAVRIIWGNGRAFPDQNVGE
jgi:hypothetical protein